MRYSTTRVCMECECMCICKCVQIDRHALHLTNHVGLAQSCPKYTCTYASTKTNAHAFTYMYHILVHLPMHMLRRVFAACTCICSWLSLLSLAV